MSPERQSDAGLSTPQALGTAAPLVEAARLLLDRTPDALGEIDLSPVVVVTPGRRAGRQLLVALDEVAGNSGIRFVPPRLTTAPELDETLAVAGRPAAADEPSIKGSKMSSALQGAILSFDREAKLHKVRRQSSIDGATLGKALRKKELKRWATEPAMGNAGTDHIAGMLAKALLQRRAQSRVSVVDCDDDEAFDE